ncbi:uncharacterized protein LOC134729733 [Pan paniscus]|uniref:uncharacterized protein LOC134729733 n=1 Tax=Pan paniscus TaxID=9597 RepID=UPI003004551A
MLTPLPLPPLMLTPLPLPSSPPPSSHAHSCPPPSSLLSPPLPLPPLMLTPLPLPPLPLFPSPPPSSHTHSTPPSSSLLSPPLPLPSFPPPSSHTCSSPPFLISPSLFSSVLILLSSSLLFPSPSPSSLPSPPLPLPPLSPSLLSPPPSSLPLPPLSPSLLSPPPSSLPLPPLSPSLLSPPPSSLPLPPLSPSLLSPEVTLKSLAHVHPQAPIQAIPAGDPSSMGLHPPTPVQSASRILGSTEPGNRCPGRPPRELHCRVWLGRALQPRLCVGGGKVAEETRCCWWLVGAPGLLAQAPLLSLPFWTNRTPPLLQEVRDPKRRDRLKPRQKNVDCEDFMDTY